MNILIIEDEPRIAQLLQRGLEESGYKTAVTYDDLFIFRHNLNHDQNSL